MVEIKVSVSGPNDWIFITTATNLCEGKDNSLGFANTMYIFKTSLLIGSCLRMGKKLYRQSEATKHI